MPVILPVLLIGSGLAFIFVLATIDTDGPVPDHPPDLPPMPGSTGYRRIDAILGALQKAAQSSGIPLGLLVGWIAKESGGRLDEAPKALKGERDSERGYFQLTPSESDRLGLDHARLSTDPQYSIDAGIRLIGEYMKAVDSLGVAQKGTPYYWDLVKLGHTMGSGAMHTIVAAAQAAGQASSWNALEQFAFDHEAQLKTMTKHSPTKWFPLVDEVAQIGQPFGYGSASGGTVLVGADIFGDIPDPLNALKWSGG